MVRVQRLQTKCGCFFVDSTSFVLDPRALLGQKGTDTLYAFDVSAEYPYSIRAVGTIILEDRFL